MTRPRPYQPALRQVFFRHTLGLRLAGLRLAGPWLAILLALSSASLLAQALPIAQTPQSSQAPSVASGDIELEHSRVYVRVDKARVGHEHAVIGKLKSGQLQLKAADQANLAVGTLVFDMTTFDADTAEARKYIGMQDSIDDSTRKQVNENMLGKAVLDVRNHPTATFVGKKISHIEKPSARGLPQYEVEGDFTLHGVTRAIKFTVDVEEVKGWRRVRGAFAILQSNFGIKPFTKAFGVIGVADKLDIYGDLIVAP